MRSVRTLLSAAAFFACLSVNPLMAQNAGGNGNGRAAAPVAPNHAIEIDEEHVLVRFHPSSPEAERARSREAVHGRKVKDFDLVPGLELIHVEGGSQRAAETMRGHRNVQYAEPDARAHTSGTPNDPSFAQQWGLTAIHAPVAWDTTTGSPAVVVAIIDGGMVMNHPDLVPNLWVNPGEIPGNGIDDDHNGYIDDVNGWDWLSGDRIPDDTDMHGTHLAGIVGAVGNNGTGISGVCWNVRIMPLKWIGANGGSVSSAISALNYAVRNGARISNHSWGTYSNSSSLRDAINAAGAAGHLVVCSAGNSGANLATSPEYPAAFNLPNLITVAATDSADNLASYSNYSSTLVHLGAPGDGILSTYGSGYGYMSGTSMAAPHVVGVAALLLSQNPSMTVADLRNRILTSVRPLPSLSGKTVTGGVLDTQAALSNLPPPPTGNTAPTISISQPAASMTITEGVTISLVATAMDTQDGSLTNSIRWTSDLQGVLGTGGSFNVQLAAGVHTITATVSDTAGLTASATSTVNVQGYSTSVPTAPASVSTSAASGTVTIRWADQSFNETGFEVQRQAKVGRQWGTEQTIATVGAGIVSATNASGSGTFRYRVRAVGDAGASAWSAWAQIKVR